MLLDEFSRCVWCHIIYGPRALKCCPKCVKLRFCRSAQETRRSVHGCTDRRQWSFATLYLCTVGPNLDADSAWCGINTVHEPGAIDANEDRVGPGQGDLITEASVEGDQVESNVVARTSSNQLGLISDATSVSALNEAHAHHSGRSARAWNAQTVLHEARKGRDEPCGEGLARTCQTRGMRTPYRDRERERLICVSVSVADEPRMMESKQTVRLDLSQTDEWRGMRG